MVQIVSCMKVFPLDMVDGRTHWHSTEEEYARSFPIHETVQLGLLIYLQHLNIGSHLTRMVPHKICSSDPAGIHQNSGDCSFRHIPSHSSRKSRFVILLILGMAEIANFFKERDIFITGGSGFIGKVLIEKLLRSCAELNKIYILMRSKKDRSAEDRLEDIISLPLFDLLRKNNPDALKKIAIIEGDVSMLRLGISDKDVEILSNVSVIFHAAASVRFDDPLKEAILKNTRGTVEMCKLAEKLPNLKVMLHVSTVYCYPDRQVIEEKLYDPYADWKVTVKMAEKYDTETLNILYAKYSSFQPNTYTFTKNLAEHVVKDFKDRIPLILFRPSIVISSLSEPIPGWLDNFNGPVGIFVASGIGILRTMHADPDIVSDYMPVDVAVKGMILAAYKRGTQTDSNDVLPVLNCSSSATRAVSTGHVIEMAKQLIWENPLEKMLWVPGGDITKCEMYNLLRFLVSHVFVAMILDTIFRLLKMKAFLLKLQRRIYCANGALHYFITKNWTFTNDNFVALDALVPKSEFDAFAFLHLKDLDIRQYFSNALVGAKKYLLKESGNQEEWSKKKLYILNAIDKTLKFIFLAFAIKFIFKLNYMALFSALIP